VLNPIDYSGPLGGFYAGGNYQFNQFLVGIDADYTWAGLDGTGLDTNPANGAKSTHSDQINWVSTVAGRVGWVSNNWLLFAKGGWGWAGFAESSATYSGAGALRNTSTGSSTHDGWTVGGGVEYGLGPHLSAKLEYDYVKFDTATVTITETTTTTGAVGFPTRSVTASMDMVKVGLGYRF
jgi:outer membrane immunogenic protein